VRQFDTPERLYEHPNDSFVAGFIGSPSMNLYRVELGAGAHSLLLGSQNVNLPQQILSLRPGLARYAGRTVVVGMRPEFLRLDGPSDDPGFYAEANLIERLGNETLVHFAIDAAVVSSGVVETGDPRSLDVEGEGVAKIDASSTPRTGDRLRFSIPGERLHFFDAETQMGIWE
jgi:ABC-type sugar transport system ATPase subunit